MRCLYFFLFLNVKIVYALLLHYYHNTVSTVTATVTITVTITVTVTSTVACCYYCCYFHHCYCCILPHFRVLWIGDNK